METVRAVIFVNCDVAFCYDEKLVAVSSAILVLWFPLIYMYRLLINISLFFHVKLLMQINIDNQIRYGSLNYISLGLGRFKKE